MKPPTGYTLADWFTLLREVNFSVDREYYSRAYRVTVFSFMNSWYLKQENRLYLRKFNKVKIESPIFILGHWRHGTTLLHELLAMDEQFAYPNQFEISRPHTFLSREPYVERLPQDPELDKRPTDQMVVNYRSPGEDESALAILSSRSPMVSWNFPRYEDRYDRYLTFNDVPEDDLLRWKIAISLFMKKLTYRYNRSLLMKSPAHTARIKILTDLFPDARFIHIHRNPFTVFQSTVKLYNTAVYLSYLQNPKPGSIISGIIRRYKAMYDAFFDQKDSVASDRFIEIGFEELERDTLGALRNIYTRLGIEGYDQARPGFEAYLRRVQGYKKNQFKEIPEPLRSEVVGAWKHCFDEWGYSAL